MAQIVTSTAVLKCSFGTAPAVLTILPVNRVLASELPAANINDFVPMLNVPPFALCESLANPCVAAATAAALGVLTPQPCVPVLAAPWVPVAPRVMVAGQPVLAGGAVCLCTWAGEVSIDTTGQERASAGS
ncbi:MAG: DUF4280 domain-containing protein [Alphaproteobacteria bacterium]